jgi:hypothetical protein
MKQESARISRLLVEIQKEQEKYNAELATFMLRPVVYLAIALIGVGCVRYEIRFG